MLADDRAGTPFREAPFGSEMIDALPSMGGSKIL